MQLQQIYHLPKYYGPLPPVTVLLSSAPASNGELPLISRSIKSSISPMISIAEKDSHADDNESDGDNELRNDKDEDEVLRMTDVLTKIMV